MRLANADIIPYAITPYATDFETHVNALSQRAQTIGFSFDKTVFDPHIQKLATISKQYETQRNTFPDNPHVLQQVNQQLMSLERTWLHPSGLQERPWSRSLFGAEDPFEGYAPWMLPGLRWEIEQQNDSKFQHWTEIYVQALMNLEKQVQKLVDLY